MSSIKTRTCIKDLITWICRLITGGVFLFSGFVKAIDPWGTIYKFNDYLAVFGWDIGEGLVFAGVTMLCMFEFLTGAFIVTGSFRKAAPVMATLMMLVMTPLTLWIAIYDPVPDCGCFGDALVISNWATFWKNIGICGAVVWLLIYNRRTHWLITPSLQWLGFVADVAFVGVVGAIGYFYQPLIDYRPYKVGLPLINLNDEAHEPQFSFIYEKDGVSKEFGLDDELPDESEGWRFVERKELPAKGPLSQKSGDGRNLVVTDMDDNDITSQVVEQSGAQFLLLMPDISEVSPASSYQINSMQGFAQEHGIGFAAIVSGSSEEISRWKDLSLARYPIYTSEDTTIKEIARGNPAVVYLEDGTVVWKSTLRALPYDDFMSQKIVEDPRQYAFDNSSILRNIVLIYISVIAVVILLSFSPKVKDMFTLGSIRVKKINPDDSNQKLK